MICTWYDIGSMHVYATINLQLCRVNSHRNTHNNSNNWKRTINININANNNNNNNNNNNRKRNVNRTRGKVWFFICSYACIHKIQRYNQNQNLGPPERTSMSPL